MTGKDEGGDRAARRIIERVNAESEARMPAGQVDEPDRAEYWGRRIGRVLSVVLLVALVYWIYDMVAGQG